MSGIDHRRWEDDLAAYALGALEGPELGQFEAHLGGCERCQSELQWLQPAIDAIPGEIEEILPPRRLRRRLMAIVRQEARASAGARGGRALNARALILRPATAAAATALIVAGGVGGYVLAGPGGGATQTTIAMKATAPLARDANAVLLRHGDAGTLEAHGLPALPDGKVYEVWVSSGRTIRPSSVFVVDRRGAGVAAIPAQLTGADEVMVTQEPKGGSRQPTSAPILRATLG